MELDPHIDVDSAAPAKVGRGARGKYRMTPHEGEMCRRLVYALRVELKAHHRTNEQVRVAIGDSESRKHHTREDVSAIRQGKHEALTLRRALVFCAGLRVDPYLAMAFEPPLNGRLAS